MINQHNPVIIAGAGPGGLTLALLLHKHKIPCQVFEAVSELKPLGVGINILPHAVRVYSSLGLEEELKTLGIETSTLTWANKFGQTIKADPRGLRAGYKYPQVSLHRGEYQMLLYGETAKRLGEGIVQTGHKLESWQDTPEGIDAHFKTPDGETITVSGACLIAADGIKSTARARLYPDEGLPKYSGQLMWRAVTEGAPFLDGCTMLQAGRRSQKFVVYPIANKQGKQVINWIAEKTVPDYDKLDQDWTDEVPKEVFLCDFEGWDFGFLNVPALIRGTDKIYEYPMTDRDPLPKWTHGNMTLLGDAAHPMYPIGSNGASQAVLDAECLAQELVSAKTPSEAMKAYEAVRLPATANIVKANRGDGPDIIMELAAERAPNGYKHIHDVIPEEELESLLGKYKQTAGFSVKQVNR